MRKTMTRNEGLVAVLLHMLWKARLIIKPIEGGGRTFEPSKEGEWGAPERVAWHFEPFYGRFRFGHPCSQAGRHRGKSAQPSGPTVVVCSDSGGCPQGLEWGFTGSALICVCDASHRWVCRSWCGVYVGPRGGGREHWRDKAAERSSGVNSRIPP